MQHDVKALSREAWDNRELLENFFSKGSLYYNTIKFVYVPSSVWYVMWKEAAPGSVMVASSQRHLSPSCPFWNLQKAAYLSAGLELHSA